MIFKRKDTTTLIENKGYCVITSIFFCFLLMKQYKIFGAKNSPKKRVQRQDEHL
ncbi:MAG: hypothetical protein RI894_520 [Bacteroidota bacterium]|jgi:hypothetical protein